MGSNCRHFQESDFNSCEGFLVCVSLHTGLVNIVEMDFSPICVNFLFLENILKFHSFGCSKCSSILALTHSVLFHVAGDTVVVLQSYPVESLLISNMKRKFRIYLVWLCSYCCCHHIISRKWSSLWIHLESASKTTG